jgi:serine protease AprX
MTIRSTEGDRVYLNPTSAGRRLRRRAVQTAVAALLLSPLAASATAGSGTAQGPASGMSSVWAADLWSSTLTSSTATTLADVRTIIGAGTRTAAASLTGQGVGVALIDTGVAPVAGLPAAQIVNGPDLSFESQSTSLRYLDTYGHGTHMAGIIVGNDVATGTKGIAPRAKLTSIKIGTANGAVDVSQTIAAIDWVIEHKNDDRANPIRVINLSYGTGGNPSPLTDPVAYAVQNAWNNGIVVVTATGNQGNNYQVTNPAVHSSTIAVGATATKGTLSTSDDDMATFTNGRTPDLGKAPDLLAPGVSVVSLRDPNSNIDLTYPLARVGTTLFRGSGTSQATAVTSAAVALLLQYKPSLTPDQVKSYLLTSRTNPRSGLAATYETGFINVKNAIAKINAGAAPPLWDSMWSDGTGRLEDGRGTSHVTINGVQLKGERSIFGPFNSTIWASRTTAGTAWRGGVWMGSRFAGDGWTGTSWASKTWAGAMWTGTAWDGSSWIDPNWSGHYWSGHYWSGHYWSGHYWSTDEWSSVQWG